MIARAYPDHIFSCRTMTHEVERVGLRATPGHFGVDTFGNRVIDERDRIPLGATLHSVDACRQFGIEPRRVGELPNRWLYG
jgi:hypothetical protein